MARKLAVTPSTNDSPTKTIMAAAADFKQNFGRKGKRIRKKITADSGTTNGRRRRKVV